MIRNIISPLAVSTAVSILTCTAIMMYTGINMAPAIALNALYVLATDTPPAFLLRKLAMTVFNPMTWRPYRVAFSISATISIIATFYVFCLQIASRMLIVMLTLTRARTPEQNLAAIISKWNTYSVFYVSDAFAETFSAIVVFICMMWATIAGAQLIMNDAKLLSSLVCDRINGTNNRRSVPTERYARAREPIDEKTYADILLRDLKRHLGRLAKVDQVQRQAPVRPVESITNSLANAPVPEENNRLNCANRCALRRQQERDEHVREDAQLAQDLVNTLALMSEIQTIYDMIANTQKEENTQSSEPQVPENCVDDNGCCGVIAEKTVGEKTGADRAVPEKADDHVSVAEQLPRGFMDTNNEVKENEKNQSEESAPNNVATVEDDVESN